MIVCKHYQIICLISSWQLIFCHPLSYLLICPISSIFYHYLLFILHFLVQISPWNCPQTFSMIYFSNLLLIILYYVINYLDWKQLVYFHHMLRCLIFWLNGVSLPILLLPWLIFSIVYPIWLKFFVRLKLIQPFYFTSSISFFPSSIWLKASQFFIQFLLLI